MSHPDLHGLPMSTTSATAAEAFNTTVLSYLRYRTDVSANLQATLAADPEKTMEEVCNWLEIPYEAGLTQRFRDGNHGIAGNPSRAESKPIQLDDKWRRNLPAPLAKFSYLMNSSLARRYGHTN